MPDPDWLGPCTDFLEENGWDAAKRAMIDHFADPWIPVNRAWPISGEPVLVMRWAGMTELPTIGELAESGSSYRWCDRDGREIEVTKWMPIPESDPFEPDRTVLDAHKSRFQLFREVAGTEIVVHADEWQPAESDIGIMRGFFAEIWAETHDGQSFELTSEEEERFGDEAAEAYEDDYADYD